LPQTRTQPPAADLRWSDRIAVVFALVTLFKGYRLEKIEPFTQFRSDLAAVDPDFAAPDCYPLRVWVLTQPTIPGWNDSFWCGFVSWHCSL
jgi:hypothetical protein